MQILLEHNATPGTTYDDCLIIGSNGFILNEMELNESVDKVKGNSTLKFKGKFQEADVINKNKRIYPKKVLEENIERIQEIIKKNSLLGQADHPDNSIVSIREASHIITKFWWGGENNNILFGEGEILNTPNGKLVRALLNDGVHIGISSRGVGSGVVKESGELLINQFKLVTFDLVADASTPGAGIFQQKIKEENNNINITPNNNSTLNKNNNLNNLNKNETTSINTVNKDVLLACLNEMVKKQVNNIKERLS